MGLMATVVPMALLPEGRAREVSFAARVSNMLFGAPNARRANGIVSASFDVAGWLRRALRALTGAPASVPVFAIDRMGTEYRERLPRIWLSEKVANTRHDAGRVFVESYPSAPDRGGEVALELGDRYLGEGFRAADCGCGQAVECFKAAEILYLHAVRRGNREAASRLRGIYDDDLCRGDYWRPRLEARAKHARRRDPARRGRACRL